MSKANRDFFVDSQHGAKFVESLHAMIDREHERAENEPDSSRDHTQRAKGIRDVINEIKRISVAEKEETES